MVTPKLSTHRRTRPIDAAKLPASCLSTAAATALPAPIQTNSVPVSAYFDLVVIGAGPASVALLSRLMEKRPAALYLEDEHRYLHWLQSKASSPHGRRSDQAEVSRAAVQTSAPLLKTQYRPRSTERVFVGASGQAIASSPQVRHGMRSPRPLRILVVDRIGGWLGLWNRLFAAYEIPHLRSPMFFHPSPADLDALLAYAQRTARNTTGTWQPEPLVCAAVKSVEGSDKERPKKASKSARRKLKNGAHDSVSPDGIPPEPMQPTGPELIEIRGCVGKEITKHKRKKARAQQHHNHGGNQLGSAVNERDRRDYYTPGTRLFHDFVCTDLLQRYGLPGTDAQQAWPTLANVLEHSSIETDNEPPQTTTSASNEDGSVQVARGEVTMMSWHPDLHIAGHGHVPAMRMCAADGSTFAAGTVVSAIGPGGMPNVPDVLKAADAAARAARADEQLETQEHGGTKAGPRPAGPFGRGWCHSAALALPHFAFPPAELRHKIDLAGKEGQRSGPTCVVIGGGLTSAQLCILALRKGFGKVILLLRGHMKVKPFDVSLDWLSKWANTMKMQFWQEDDPAERLKMLRSARNGGSITPAYARYLRELERAGLLEIRTHVEIDSLEWADDDEDRWEIQLRCTCDQSSVSQAAAVPTPTPPDDGKDDRGPGAEQEAATQHGDCEPCAEPACAGASLHEPDCDSDDEGGRCARPGDAAPSKVDADVNAQRPTVDEAKDAENKVGNSMLNSEDDSVSRGSNGSTMALRADYILTSTGPILSLPTLPAFAHLAQTHPIPTFGGLPVVSEDLQWITPTLNSSGSSHRTQPAAATSPSTHEQPRLFMVGAYAALQIGPAAFNLGGMREAAERVASRLLRDWEAEADADADADAMAGNEAELGPQLVDVVEGGNGRDTVDAEDTGATEGEERARAEVAASKTKKKKKKQADRGREREPWQTGRWSSLVDSCDESLILAT